MVSGLKTSGGLNCRLSAATIVGIVAIVFAIVLPAVLMPSQYAWAYYNFGTVGIYPGSSYLQVQVGSSTSTNVSFDPASHNQTPGCGMAECPQTCGQECFDADGQCICAGAGKTTYYAEAYASSNNPGVANAYLYGNTLTVEGLSPGTATVEIRASLRQFSDGVSYVTVEVSAPPAPAPAPQETPSTMQESTAQTEEPPVAVQPTEQKTATSQTSESASAASPETSTADSSETAATSTIEEEAPGEKDSLSEQSTSAASSETSTTASSKAAAANIIEEEAPGEKDSSSEQNATLSSTIPGIVFGGIAVAIAAVGAGVFVIARLREKNALRAADESTQENASISEME